MSNSPEHPTDSPPNQPTKRERNAVETKKRLLDAAEQEFGAKGFAGARLKEIAKTVGVQQALIHHYFNDKEGLYRSVIDRALEDIMNESWAILEKAQGLIPITKAFINLLIRFHQNHSNLFAIMRMEAAAGESTATEVMRAKTKPVIDAIDKLAQHYQAKGELRSDVSSSDLLILIMSLTIFPFQEASLIEALWMKQDMSPEAVDARREAIVQVALSGVLGPNSSLLSIS
jgi:TetR/AcrR family transcriptional regulator